MGMSDQVTEDKVMSRVYTCKGFWIGVLDSKRGLNLYLQKVEGINPGEGGGGRKEDEHTALEK